MFNQKECLFCKKIFLPSRQDKRIIYCSKKCREYYWVKTHPEQSKQHQKKYQLKIPVLCRLCNLPIPNAARKSGVVFCSSKCRRAATQNNMKKYRDKEYKQFKDFKLSVGCYLCGYKKFAGSLDFHHIDPYKKDKRAMNLHRDRKEIEKCILVCKNCHYELHDLLRKNLNLYYDKIAENGDVF